MDANLIGIQYSYQILYMVLSLLMIAFVIIIVADFFTRKSQKYRKLLADMYVAGKINIIAKKDGINLSEEEKNFNLWCKKKRLEFQDLDKTIEEELKEKVSEDTSKALNKKE